MKKSLTRAEHLVPLPEVVDPQWHNWYVAEVEARRLEAKVCRLRRLRIPENSHLVLTSVARAKSARLRAAREFRFVAISVVPYNAWSDSYPNVSLRRERHRAGITFGNHTWTTISRGTHSVMSSSLSLAEVLSSTKLGQRWQSPPQALESITTSLDNQPDASILT
jgi:hypothetical protein